MFYWSALRRISTAGFLLVALWLMTLWASGGHAL